MVLDARVRAEVSRRGTVPSVTAMAQALGAPRTAVHRAYHRLGINRSPGPRSKRRLVAGRYRVSEWTYAQLCRQAREAACTISEVVGDILEGTFPPQMER